MLDNNDNNKITNRNITPNKISRLIVIVILLWLLVTLELTFVYVNSQQKKLQQELLNSSLVLTVKLIDYEFRLCSLHSKKVYMQIIKKDK